MTDCFHFGEYLRNYNLLFNPWVDRCLVTGGCALCFSILLSSGRMQRILSTAWLVRLGEACYGIYLIHILLLIVFADYMRQRMGLWGTFAVYMVMTVALALVLARLVERPMIRLGKKLSFKK